MKQFLLLFLCTFLSFAALTGQSSSDLWQSVDPATIDLTGPRVIQPTKFTALRLNEVALLDLLSTAPLEGEAAATNSSTLLEIPLSDGTVESFRIVEYYAMEAGLRAKYPGFRTYYGRGKDNPERRIRLDWTAAGFRAVLRVENGTAFVDPFAKGDTEYYVSYFKADYPAPAEPFECGVAEDREKIDGSEFLGEAGDCQFRSYRLAIACTAEYSNFHGANDPSESGLVLAEVLTSVNRVNDPYEIDFGVRLILIDDADNVFYYDAATDPYTNGNPGQMIGEVGPDLNANVGSANYDVGHVYGTDSGGLASLRVPCTGSNARGVTGSGNPTNDPFWIDYVAHELGHQFGGNHTQNNGCNRSAASFEPGSASTIMGYAGICTPNVQSNSDAYFHAISIAEASNYIVNGNGNGCATIIPGPNNAPTVEAGANYTIPSLTPYVLTATGSDADPSDVLTYCWEQYDNEVGEIMPPDPNNLQGPMFRSLIPTTSNQRYFPALTTVIANATDAWETLSAVTRPLDFRVTVRDNSFNAGPCTAEDDMRVTVSQVAGPFLVTAPNTAAVWYENETKTISWNVANTDLAPVNCAAVDIKLSYDGGLTYSVILAADVPNTGTASVVIPQGPTTTARIMVMCADNIFYDISNQDFTIESEITTFTAEAAPAAQLICAGEDVTLAINTNALNGFTGTVAVTASGVPTGAVLNFDTPTFAAGSSTTATIANTAVVAPGVYNITITASSSGIVRAVDFTLTVNGFPPNVLLSTPFPFESSVPTTPEFSWSPIPGTTTYEFQLASDPGFNDILIDEILIGSSFQPPLTLDLLTTYYWRVRVLDPCPGPYSFERNFTTSSCLTVVNNNPLEISAGDPDTYTSVINVNRMGVLDSISLPAITGTHSWIGDLNMALIAPDNTRIELFSDLCGFRDDFDIGFNDTALEAVADAPCTPLGQGGIFRPVDNLNILAGEDIMGDWTLEITDNADNDGGVLQRWSMQLCIDLSALPVEWRSFRATAQETDIKLDWQTAAELNNATFEIERMADYETDFSKIGELPAARNAANGSSYRYLDKTVKAGVNYFYRIRQLDFDGSSTVSEVRTARLAQKTSAFSVFPNPVSNLIYGRQRGIQTNNTLVELFDLRGRRLRQLTAVNATFQLSVVGLRKGVYLLRMSNGDHVQTERVVVQ
jgi:subtilisin-like proprotein convertase family protein